MNPTPGALGRRRLLALGVLCVGLVLAFSVLRFPWDLFRPMAEARLSALVGGRVTIGEFALRPALTGLGMSAGRVVIELPSGTVLELAEVDARPALALSWIRGVPALVVDVRAEAGRAVGTVGPERLDLELSGVDPSLLPDGFGGGATAPLTGLLDADIDLERDEEWTGGFEVRGEEGSLLIPGSPVALPYERLEAAATLAPGGRLEIAAGRLTGPMFHAEAQGSLAGLLGPLERAGIDLQVALREIDPTVERALAPLGIRSSGGRADLALGGTLAQPRLER